MIQDLKDERKSEFLRLRNKVTERLRNKRKIHSRNEDATQSNTGDTN